MLKRHVIARLLVNIALGIGENGGRVAASYSKDKCHRRVALSIVTTVFFWLTPCFPIFLFYTRFGLPESFLRGRAVRGIPACRPAEPRRRSSSRPRTPVAVFEVRSSLDEPLLNSVAVLL